MATFTFETLKQGYADRPLQKVVSLVAIQFEPCDQVVVVPTEYEGLPVTAIGYRQDFVPAHEHWHDWHHPTAYGSEWRPDEYTLTFGKDIVIPATCKKLVLPKTTDRITWGVFDLQGDTQIVIASDEGEKPLLRQYIKEKKPKLNNSNKQSKT